MVSISQSHTHCSLMEQKQRQWAQEREELSGLWSPWGKDSNVAAGNIITLNGKENYKHNPDGSLSYKVTAASSSSAAAPLINYSQSEYYLPPIKSEKKKQDFAHGRYENRSKSLISPPDRSRFTLSRDQYQEEPNKLNNNDKGLSAQLVPYEHRSTYHKEGNAEWMIIHKDGEAESPTPRVLVHKIYMDSTTDGRMSSRGSGDFERKFETFVGGSEGSTGHLNKPPPVAMRSSINIGVAASPQTKFGSFQELAKTEREQWLIELDKQKEEQRIRKQVEKDVDRRARWGERGIGVGHFWEPSERMGSSERQFEENTAAPSWLQRSLQLQSASSWGSMSRSHPNLYDGPLPSQQQRPDLLMGSSGSVGMDGRRSRSGERIENQDNEQRTFLRGQNVPIDPNELVEKERKMRANQEYLEEIKKQIEDRKRRQQEERDREKMEEREHEMRMAKQRRLEMERLEQEERRRRGNQPQASRSNENDSNLEQGMTLPVQAQTPDPTHESPLIPHQLEAEQDAYELAIARRQNLMLSREKSISDPDLPLQSATPPPYHKQAGTAAAADQCLMTDSDHLYERTLTPSFDRQRPYHRNTTTAREVCTQTEHSTTTTDMDETEEGDCNTRRSRSLEKRRKQEEKPRWGSNPVRKVYLTQSEKDVNYQQKLRNRQRMSIDIEAIYHGKEDPRSQSQQPLPLPFHRVQSRARAKSKSKPPLKAFGRNSSQVQGRGRTAALSPYLSLSSKVEATSASYNKSKSPLKHNSSSSSVRLQKKTNRSDKISSSFHNKKNNSSNNPASRDLGRIIGGLNSVGASEESSGFSSPSITRGECSTGSSFADPGGQYVPMYSKEFTSQRQFDEQPIKVGRTEPGLESAFIERIPSKSQMQPTLKTTTRKTLELKPEETEEIVAAPAESHHGQRPSSPPVPALANKLSLGLRPDETGRLSSLPSELLSPRPTPVPILLINRRGTLTGHSGTTAPTSSHGFGERSKMSSAEPKIDIDIAITSKSNPDLQELLGKHEKARLRRLSGSISSGIPSAEREEQEEEEEEEEEELLKLPDILSGRSSNPPSTSRSYGTVVTTSRSRPLTNTTDISLQAQEEFIREIMSQTEVQAQLSARKGELSEKGIIEFNIRLPSNWAPNTSTTLKSGRKSSSRSKTRTKKAATAQWLHSLGDDFISPREALFANLSALKQGFKLVPTSSSSSSSKDC